MKFFINLIMTLFLTLTLSSCSFDNNGDEAQRQADIEYQKSVSRCNEIKGSYVGNITTNKGSVIAMEAGIYCVDGQKSEIDKEGNVIAQVTPKIILMRQDFPIPSILTILYQGNGPISGKLESSSGDPSNEKTGFNPVKGSLASSISIDSFSGFRGSKVGSQIVAEIVTTNPVGQIVLEKIASEFQKDLLPLETEVDNKLAKTLSHFTEKSFHGCIKFSNGSNDPKKDKYANIQITMSITDANKEGKLVKELQTRFFRYDLPGSPDLNNVRMNSAFTIQENEVSIAMSREDLAPIYQPKVNGRITLLSETAEGNKHFLFSGNFSANQEEGTIKLETRDSNIEGTCRKYMSATP